MTGPASAGPGHAINYPKMIIEFSNDLLGFHPTQKPIALIEYLIKTYSNEGDLILDNCMGSGSTGIACYNTNRNFIGIEKDEKYFNVCEERIGLCSSHRQLSLI